MAGSDLSESLPVEHVKPKKTLGVVSYTERPVNGERLYSIIHETKVNGQTTTNMVPDERTVEVHDIRTAGKEFSLERNGFELHKLHVPADIDWSNPKEVKEKYYPAAEAVMKQVTGATRVHIFDHVARYGHVKEPDTKTLPTRGVPQGSVHVDFDHRSGPDRVAHYIPDDADKLRETPFAIVQVWRPLKGPVRSSPLGLIDVETVERGDLSMKDTHRPERLARTFTLHHNPNHKWYYAAGIDTDEAYLFVCYDSRLDRARFTPHSAFKDLSVGEDAPPRESVEIRSYVFWENEEPREVLKVY